MFSTFERPSAEALNGAASDTLTCDFDRITHPWREDAKGVNTEPTASVDAPRHATSAIGAPSTSAPLLDASPSAPARYSLDELVLRSGVPHAAVSDVLRSDELHPSDALYSDAFHYAAIDVVRLAVVDRLVRSGVPVARAAALVRAAESRAAAGV